MQKHVKERYKFLNEFSIQFCRYAQHCRLGLLFPIRHLPVAIER